MIYLTYGNYPFGVYSSFVIGTCRYLSEQKNTKVKLVALISIRGFFKYRRAIKAEYSNSIVLPSFPKIRNWKLNLFVLGIVFAFRKNRNVFALSPVAANLALILKGWGLVNRIVYEGEGATAAEWREYDVVSNKKMEEEIIFLEKKAVLETECRRAVSKKLIEYWNREYAYTGTKHTVIPCTLNPLFLGELLTEGNRQKLRNELGFNESDVILVFSGSASPWHSFDLIDQAVSILLESNKDLKFLLLSNIDIKRLSIYIKYPGRVFSQWVDHEKVPLILEICDYGMLLRNKTITNQTSAPTKFAEYLACGLRVLISEEIGDYSNFTSKHNCGSIVTSENISSILLDKPGPDQKLVLRNLAKKHFTREHYSENYNYLLNTFN